MARSSLLADQLYLVHQSRVRRNDIRALFPQPEHWRDDQLPALANLHAWNSFLPPPDHRSASEDKGKGMPIGRTVKYRSICKTALVGYRDIVPQSNARGQGVGRFQYLIF